MTTNRKAFIALMGGLLLGAVPGGESLMALLEKGPLVLIETNKAGKFERATAIALINAPAETVWETITHFENYANFMPKLLESTIQKREGNTVWTYYEIEVPGPNTTYTVKSVLDKDHLKVNSYWADGDLEDSQWSWEVVPVNSGKTVVYYGGTTRNFSTIAQKLEDEQQTITVGVNVTGVLATVKALKARVEGKLPEGRKKPEED